MNRATPRESQVRDMIAEVMRRNARRLRGHRVFVFGSRASGRARPNSDFDIGVIGQQALSTQDYFAIEDDLDALPTLYKIDWVDFNRASPRFVERALRQIEVIHQGEP